MTDERPLCGIRVIEIGQLLAGPFAGTMLAYFGAEVIKIEAPGDGDPIRRWRILENGTSLWWRSLGRNKKCITLDLHDPRGREICRRLIDGSDVVIENFRPGTMERWGLGPDAFSATNPGLVYTRVSGFGQTGPHARRPGYAAVCEAIGGLRHLCGEPGGRPVRPNLSLGDTLGGLHAVIGTLLALVARRRRGGDGFEAGSGDLKGADLPDRSAATRDRGQVVDVALYESVFNVLESVVPEYHRRGEVRQASGATITGIVPSNTYRCADGEYVVIGANGTSVFRRLMIAIGRADLADDDRLADNPGRVARAEEIEGVIAAFAATHEGEKLERLLADQAVPVGRIYDARAMANDPHFRARGLFEEVEVDGRPLEIPAIMPRLADTPGETRWPGPALGEHNAEIFGDLLGLSDAEQEVLRAAEVI